jgi:hypothetical protein
MSLSDNASTMILASTDGLDVVRFGESDEDGETFEAEWVTGGGDTLDWFFDLFPKDAEPHRAWKATDAWRGHFQTWDNLTGLEKVAEGWATGDWEDVPGKRAWHAFTTLLQAEAPPVAVYVLMEPTSNVFSTAVDVAVLPGKAAEFDAWLATHDLSIGALKAALR